MVLRKGRYNLFLSKFLKNKVVQNFTLIILFAVFQAINNIILGRYLSKEAYGLYSLIFLNIVQVLACFLLFGQNTSIIRYFSSKKIGDYNWRYYLKGLSVFSFVLLLILAMILKWIYALSWTYYFFIVITTTISSFTLLMSSFLRARKLINRAVFLERMSILFFSLLIGIVYFTNTIEASSVYFLKMFSWLIVLPIVIYMFFKEKNGEKQVENVIFKDGIRLWEISLTMIVMQKIDAFIIPKLLSYAELGLYSVLMLIMQLYFFASTALWNVNSQKFSQKKDLNYKLLWIEIAVISGLLTIFYLFSTKFLLNLFFEGKYQTTIKLVFLFCVYGVLKIIYVVPSSYIIGRSTTNQMRQFFIMNIFSIILKFIIIWLLCVQFSFGLYGFVISSIIAFTMRIIIGFYLMCEKGES